MADGSESMYNDRLQPIRQLGQVRTNNRAIDANTIEMILSKDENYQRKRLDEIREKEAENNKLMAQYEKTFMLDNEKEKLALYKENIGNLTQPRSEAIQLTSMEEIASLAMDLANMSEELQELIARFKV
ncbi:MCP four helix bundle domain-containing protein [Priestia megaterium]|uniref:MCP four helix bundle domain-containing protein n=1 Tax=Priestia megaterium TaxID=1404 RepID=UPI0025B6A626|nr:MCP four helix bundle domain-containing protein [Priestia megaterium]